jgi:Bacterial regulatory proteins, luxR family
MAAQCERADDRPAHRTRNRGFSPHDGGFSTREIASTLYVVEGTVKNHISNTLGKLDVRDRVRAVLRAIELGCI